MKKEKKERRALSKAEEETGAEFEDEMGDDFSQSGSTSRRLLGSKLLMQRLSKSGSEEPATEHSEERVVVHGRPAGNTAPKSGRRVRERGGEGVGTFRKAAKAIQFGARLKMTSPAKMGSQEVAADAARPVLACPNLPLTSRNIQDRLDNLPRASPVRNAAYVPS